MSGAQMKASLQLTLQDELTGGLLKLRDVLDQLRGLAKSLNLDGLKNAAREMRGAAADLSPLKAGLAGVRTEATEAAAAISAIKGATSGLGALTVYGGGGGGGGSGGGGFSGPGAPLLLGGPEGDGRIPLNFTPEGDARFNEERRGSGGHGKVDPTGGIVAGGALFESTRSYARFEQLLRQIAITEHLSGAAVGVEEARLTKMFNVDALHTGQTSESIATAYFDLLGQGIKRALLDKTIGIHSEAATAYGIDAETLGKPVGALLSNLGIDQDSLPGVLAAMATAAKAGRFKVADFAAELPNLTGPAAAIGIKGRAGADEIFAAMETIMKNTGLAGSGAASFLDLLSYEFSAREDKSFAKYAHVSLPKYLRDAEKHGVNPLDAFLKLISHLLKGKTPVEQETLLAHLVTNQQARQGVLALVQHPDSFRGLQGTLDQVNAGVLNTDFVTAAQGAQVQLAKLNENLEQTNRTFGQNFLPVMSIAASLLHPFNAGLAYMNANFPTATHWVLGLAGGLLGLVAVLSALHFAFGLLKSGFGMLFGAKGLLGLAIANPEISITVALVAALAGGAYLIYRNWGTIGPWFHGLISGLKQDWMDFEKWFETSLLGEAVLKLEHLPQLLGLAHPAGPVPGGAAAITGTIHVSVDAAGHARVAAQSHHPGLAMVVGSVGNTTRRP
jgi:TP901 family phage tail tape measure protein